MVVMVSKVKAAPKPAATSEVSQLLTCIIVINFLSFGMEGGGGGGGGGGWASGGGGGGDVTLSTLVFSNLLLFIVDI